MSKSFPIAPLTFLPVCSIYLVPSGQYQTFTAKDPLFLLEVNTLQSECVAFSGMLYFGRGPPKLCLVRGASKRSYTAQTHANSTCRWVEYGAKAKACKCSGESVRIDMRLFGVEPPPVKVRPGALLLAPPLPPPDLTAATPPLVPQGKMARRKALLPEGTAGVSPEKVDKPSPKKASLPAGAGSSPRKRKPAGEAPKRSHKKQKGVEGTPIAAPVAPGGVLLAPGLEPLPVPPPAKKRKAVGGAASPPKKGGAVAALESAPFAVGGVLAQAGGAGVSRKGSKPKASKGKKGIGAQVAHTAAPSLPAAINGVMVSPGGLAKEASPLKQKAGKGAAKKQKGKLPSAPLALSAPVSVAEIAPLTGLGGQAPLEVAVQAPPKPKRSKGKGATNTAVGGSAAGSAAVTEGGAKSKAQPLVVTGGAAVKAQVPNKILRIKFNPPAALAVAAESKGVQAPGAVADTKTPAGGGVPTRAAVQAATKLQKGVDPGGGASPPEKVGGGEVTPVSAPGVQPDSAGGSDRVRTRRGGVVEEPLAVLFKDPPTGTKLQGRKRVREGGQEGQGAGKSEVQAKSGDAARRKSKKKKGGRKEGGQKGVPTGVSIEGSNGVAAGGLGGANFAGVQAGGHVAAEPASAAIGREGVASAAILPGRVEDADRASVFEGASTALPVETTTVSEAVGGVQPSGEGAVTLLLGAVVECSPESLQHSGAQLDSALAEGEAAPSAVDTSTANGGGVTREAGSSEPVGVIGSRLVTPAVGVEGESTVTAAGLAEAAAAPVAGVPGPLPKLVSPKQKKGKKKAGSRKGPANATPGSHVAPGDGAAAPKPRQRRRGPPPVERPGTHQMSRRSTRGVPPPGKVPQTVPAVVAGVAVPEKAAVFEAAEEPIIGVTSDENLRRVETGAVGGSEVPTGESKLPVETALVLREEPLCAHPKVELLEAPVERLKGGAASEVSGAMSGGSQSQGQAGSRPRSGSEKSGRIVMRVEGSRLLLRRVKQTEGSGATDLEKDLKRGEPVELNRGCGAVRAQDEAPQERFGGALPRPVAPVLGVCVDEVRERRDRSARRKDLRWCVTRKSLPEQVC